MATVKTAGFDSGASDSEAPASSNWPEIEELQTHDVSLRDLGRKLPVGIFIDGERLQEFTLKPYTNKHDRVLGQIVARKKKLKDIVEGFLPQVVAQIGGYEVADLASRLGYAKSIGRFFSSLYLGDLTTILCAIRMEAQGEAVAMSGQCPNCRTMNQDRDGDYHDIGSLSVKCFERLAQPPKFRVSLVDGIELHGEICDHLVMEPMRTHHLDALVSDDSRNADDISLMYSMITEVDLQDYRGVRNPFGDELYDEMTHGDTQLIRAAMKKLQPGPEMFIKMDCIRCDWKWDIAIPWGDLRQFLYIPPDAA